MLIRIRTKGPPLHGSIDVWARMASVAPRLVNLVTQSRWLGAVAKWLAGIDPRRRVPRFATRTFRYWFRRRSRAASGRRVLLWPDTFNNHFHPDTARAAVEVLEAAGFRVEIPTKSLCCGRPLYDFGLLEQAKQRLREVLDALAEPIAAGVPLVVLEPSCASVFRDELVNLFPDSELARRLSRQTLLLSEFLAREAPDFRPALGRAALLHGHCHHKSLIGLDEEEAILRRMGLELRVPETGCCGMAGAFGFERGERYDMAVKCGERVLLPAVRRTDDDTLIIADGFSCREQIAQGTERRALHLADVIRLALPPEHG
jgi:Fe-S oxidoreductase